MKKALTMALAVGMAVAAMSSAAFAEEGEFNVRACIASEPETLDPNLESSVDGATYAMHLFEGLMKYVPTEDAAALDGDDKVDLLVTDFGQANPMTYPMTALLTPSIFVMTSPGAMVSL